MNKEKEEDKHRVVLIKEGHINKDADFSINIDIPDESDSLANELGSTISREMTLLNKGHRFPQTGATNAEGAQTEVESHQIGPGPDFERVLFNIKGRSPLVAHYLHMRQLAGNQNIGRHVRRTEVEKLPPPAPTYREVIKDSKCMAKAMSTEYQKQDKPGPARTHPRSLKTESSTAEEEGEEDNDEEADSEDGT
eukprot:XP_011667776.1 PREDICTED: uncharacterized protein LOC105439910 [Strongylocentrotus purpuratus]